MLEKQGHRQSGEVESMGRSSCLVEEGLKEDKVDEGWADDLK